MKKVLSLLTILAIAQCSSLKPVSANAFAKFVSGVVEAPVGGVFGLLRGATTKGAQYADAFAYETGDTPLAKIISTPIGLIVGGAVGGAVGLVNGIYTGINQSVDEAFTTEGFSLDGDFLDYDPYEFGY
jgi:hypothetical protein